jgi:CTD small phosphatase-like protein 2
LTFSAPNTPIASAKRPRPNNSAIKLDYDHDNSHPDKENESGSVLSPLKTSSDYQQPEGVAEGKPDEGKWKGHLGALFSPVLRIFGNDDSTSFDEAEQARAAEAVEEMARAASLQRREEEAAAAVAAAQEAEEEEDDLDEFNPYLFIKLLPPYDQVRTDAFLAPRLPPRRITRQQTAPTTLVLDLDETLVHCSVEGGGDADLIFPVDFNGTTYQVSVKKRPYMAKFLEMVSEKFEVVVFTASQQVYADTLLDILDPEKKLIKHRLFRDSCLLVDGNYLKDLNVLGRDLSKTVLVDNSPHAFGYQIDNGIPIESWYDDPNDTELLKLADFLTNIENVSDVRPIVRNHFRTHELIQNAKQN